MKEPTFSLEDMFLFIFVIVDDLYEALVPRSLRYRSQHHRISFSDSEVLTLSIMQEALGNDSETSFHRYVSRNYHHLFPNLISRDRYHRRRKALVEVQLHLFRHLADELGVHARYLIVDSAPIETVCFVRCQSGMASIPEARFGYVPSKKRHFFGFRLHSLLASNGAMIDFILSPADVGERVAAQTMLAQRSPSEVLADHGYFGAPMQYAAQRRGHQLWVSPKPSQPPGTREEARLRRWLRAKRDLIETAFAVLADQFKLETTRARSLWGLKTRVAAKLLAYNISLFVNLMLGRPMMKIKELYL